MGSRRGKKQLLSDKSDTENSLNDSNIHMKRRSKRITEKQNNTAVKEQEISLDVSIQDLLRMPLMQAFEYEVQEQDIEYLQYFFVELPKLKDVWSRIGFSVNIQEQRLEKLYEKLTVGLEIFNYVVAS